MQIDFGHATVDIKIEQVDVRIKLFQSLFNTFGYDVICNAAKWLYADNPVDTASCKTGYFGGYHPPFPELIR